MAKKLLNLLKRIFIYDWGIKIIALILTFIFWYLAQIEAR